MFVAIDENNKYVWADDAEKNEEYFCPTCHNKIMLRKGEHNLVHFAHFAGECTDKWNYDMSEWHREWQKQFPLECRERVMYFGDEIHRADVFINDTVIEFQHSSMSQEEFEERNKFYLYKGYNVVWLFDLSEKNVEQTDRSFQYKWLWSPTIFNGFDPVRDKNISVYFQFEDASFNISDKEDGVIEKLSWISPYESNIKFFRTKQNVCYAPFEFTALFYKSKEFYQWKDKEVKSRGKTIVEILCEIDGNAAAVKNIRTGTDVYVFKGNNITKDYRGKIYGRFVQPDGIHYYNDNREVFYALRPEWVLKFVSYK